MFFAGFLPASAQTNIEATNTTLLTVKDLPIYEQASSGKIARVNALELGAVHSFMKIVKDMLPAHDFAAMKTPSYSEVKPAILGYQARNEMVGDYSYSANVSYNFYKDKVESILESKGLVSKEYRKAPVLVLPLLTIGDEDILWEKGNVWRDAWQSFLEKNRRMFVLLPEGNGMDASMVQVSDILARDYTVLKKLKELYQADYIAIAEAEITGLSAFVRMEFVGIENDKNYVSHYTLDPRKNDLAQVLENAVLGAAQYVEEVRDSRGEGIMRHTQLRIVSGNAKDQMLILQRIEALPIFTNVEVERISREVMIVNLSYEDLPATVYAYLETQNFAISGKYDIWEIRESWQ